MCTLRTTIPKIGMALGLSALAMTLSAAQTPATQPDNSRTNKTASPTADQQKENTTDRKMAQDIRKSIVSDKSLSTYAHNVKVIVQNGAVTLNGPVKSEDEKAAVEAKAKEVAGSTPIQNNLTVATKENTGQNK